MVFARDLLNTLRRRELDAAAATLSAETGLSHRPSAEGEHVSGVYRRRVRLASGRFAIIDDGMGFQLVPWRPALEQQLGRHVSGVIAPGGNVDWSLAESGDRTLTHSLTVSVGTFPNNAEQTVATNCGRTRKATVAPLSGRSGNEFRTAGTCCKWREASGRRGRLPIEHFLAMPDMSANFAAIVYATPIQLLAYHTAVIIDKDADQPRHLVALHVSGLESRQRPRLLARKPGSPRCSVPEVLSASRRTLVRRPCV